MNKQVSEAMKGMKGALGGDEQMLAYMNRKGIVFSSVIGVKGNEYRYYDLTPKFFQKLREGETEFLLGLACCVESMGSVPFIKQYFGIVKYVYSKMLEGVGKKKSCYSWLKSLIKTKRDRLGFFLMISFLIDAHAGTTVAGIMAREKRIFCNLQSLFISLVDDGDESFSSLLKGKQGFVTNLHARSSASLILVDYFYNLSFNQNILSLFKGSETMFECILKFWVKMKKDASLAEKMMFLTSHIFVVGEMIEYLDIFSKYAVFVLTFDECFKGTEFQACQLLQNIFAVLVKKKRSDRILLFFKVPLIKRTVRIAIGNDSVAREVACLTLENLFLRSGKGEMIKKKSCLAILNHLKKSRYSDARNVGEKISLFFAAQDLSKKEMPNGHCQFCKREPKKVMTCSRCKVCYYCSRECQKSDWKRHKKLCVPPTTGAQKTLKARDSRRIRMVCFSYLNKMFQTVRELHVKKRLTFLNSVVHLDFRTGRNKIDVWSDKKYLEKVQSRTWKEWNLKRLFGFFILLLDHEFEGINCRKEFLLRVDAFGKSAKQFQAQLRKDQTVETFIRN